MWFVHILIIVLSLGAVIPSSKAGDSCKEKAKIEGNIGLNTLLARLVGIRGEEEVLTASSCSSQIKEASAPLSVPSCYHLSLDEVESARTSKVLFEDDESKSKKFKLLYSEDPSEAIKYWFISTDTFKILGSDPEHWKVSKAGKNTGKRNGGIYLVNHDGIIKFVVKVASQGEANALWRIEETYFAHPETCLPFFGLATDQIADFPRLSHIRESGMFAPKEDWDESDDDSGLDTLILMDVAPGIAIAEIPNGSETKVEAQRALNRAFRAMTIPLKRVDERLLKNKDDRDKWISWTFIDAHPDNIFYDMKTITFIDYASLTSLKISKAPTDELTDETKDKERKPPSSRIHQGGKRGRKWAWKQSP